MDEASMTPEDEHLLGRVLSGAATESERVELHVAAGRSPSLQAAMDLLQSTGADCSDGSLFSVHAVLPDFCQPERLSKALIVHFGCRRSLL